MAVFIHLKCTRRFDFKEIIKQTTIVESDIFIT
jgi:hypothetical protein